MQMMFGSVHRKVSDDPVMRKVGKKWEKSPMKHERCNNNKQI